MRYGILLVALFLAAMPAQAEFSDSDAAAMAVASPAVTKSAAAIDAAINSLPADLRDKTRDALLTDGCIAYRTGETPETQKAVVAELIRQGFASDAAALTRSLYGYAAHTDATCVHITAPFLATPGSNGSHHGWPGGLADHIAFNLHVADDLVVRYRQAMDDPTAFDSGTLRAAVLWHDWAKRLVLHWSEEGIVSSESQIAGTLAHHVIGLAEAMARHLPAKMILVQACAHDAPSGDSDPKVIGWLRAAAIIAHVDPVKAGYLKGGASGYAADFAPECRLHTMSDANWVFAVPAMKHAQAVLTKLAPQLGYKDDEARRFILRALSTYGAERFGVIDEGEALKLLKQLQAR